MIHLGVPPLLEERTLLPQHVAQCGHPFYPLLVCIPINPVLLYRIRLTETSWATPSPAEAALSLHRLSAGRRLDVVQFVLPAWQCHRP
jgi:hypothetical protein